MIRFWTMLTLAVLLAGPVRAEIYVCESDGKKTFSEKPCGQDAKVMALSGERKVEMSMTMPAADVSYLCNRAVNAWEQFVNTQRSHSASRSYGEFSFSNPADDERRRNGVLAYISNLATIERDDPDLYAIAVATMTRYSGPSTAPVSTSLMTSGRYQRVTISQPAPAAGSLSVDVGRERRSCESDLSKSLNDLHERFRSDLMSGKYRKH